MPHLLMNLVDGKKPGAMQVSPDYKPQEGEVLLSDAEAERLQNGVWDEASQTLREQTPQEAFAVEFEEAKIEKEVEFFIRALEDVLATVPEAEGTYNRVPTEKLLKALVAHFLAQAEKEAGFPEKWNQMLQVLGKLRMKRSTVGAMTPETNTIEDLNAESWDSA